MVDIYLFRDVAIWIPLDCGSYRLDIAIEGSKPFWVSSMPLDGSQSVTFFPDCKVADSVPIVPHVLNVVGYNSHLSGNAHPTIEFFSGSATVNAEHKMQC